MLRTAECTFPGHPDKVCDQISDAILDDCLKQDPDSRVAIEVMGGHGIITITGELTTKAFCYMDRIAKDVYKKLGYTDEIGVTVNVVSQSPDISQGVDTGGAGDQGIMVGYATSETESQMPLEYDLARKLADDISGDDVFGPDGKCQVTVDDKGNVETVVLSVQTPVGSDEVVPQDYVEKVLGRKIKNYHFNPTGKFEVGGFAADTGLTGRKLAVDNYGPQVPIGGGAFSGKDPSKVDRSAAYMARYLARFVLLANPEAKVALVKLAYSIGIAEPVMVSVEVDGTQYPAMSDILLSQFDLTPQGIITFLDLKRPIYQETAELGHFGKEIFKWEQVKA
jgi:S-adenosylmethionine synthetase